MPTEDHSYTARVRVARRYFGDPADYDYSLVRMVVAHPGTIAVKMLHNLPRWLSELGRRHVVLPVPAMAVLLTGLFWMARSRRRRHTCLQLMATIVMTIPVTVLYTHAEYMTPAFVGATVGIACGLAFFSRRVCIGVHSSRCSSDASVGDAHLLDAVLSVDGRSVVARRWFVC